MNRPLLRRQIERLWDGAAIVQLSGEIDITTAPTVSDQFEELAGENLTDLILDMREVSFMDSTGIHALVEGKMMVHDQGSRIILVPSAPVRRLFALVFEDQVFADRAVSLEDAIAMLEAYRDDRERSGHREVS